MGRNCAKSGLVVVATGEEGTGQRNQCSDQMFGANKGQFRNRDIDTQILKQVKCKNVVIINTGLLENTQFHY